MINNNRGEFAKTGDKVFKTTVRLMDIIKREILSDDELKKLKPLYEDLSGIKKLMTEALEINKKINEEVKLLDEKLQEFDK